MPLGLDDMEVLDGRIYHTPKGPAIWRCLGWEKVKRQPSRARGGPAFTPAQLSVLRRFSRKTLKARNGSRTLQRA